MCVVITTSEQSNSVRTAAQAASLSYRRDRCISVFILRFVVQSVSIGALLVPYIYILLILESKVCFDVDGMAKGRWVSLNGSLLCTESPFGSNCRW